MTKAVKTRKTKAAKKDIIPLSFKVNKALWAALKAEAARNCRSLSGEATHRLQASISQEA